MKLPSKSLAVILTALTACLACVAARAQNTNTLAIGSIKPLPVLVEKFTAAGKIASLRQVQEALDGQLINSMNAARKFKIMAGSDLKEILKEQDKAGSGNYNLKDPSTAEQFKLKGIKWLLTTTMDDFEDQIERRANNFLRTVSTKRTIRLSVVCKIYDTTSGELLESASHLINTNMLAETLQEAANDAEATDALLHRATREMTEWVAVRVADVIFPAKVLARTDNQVTINRGDGTGIAIGQIWIANQPGRKELKDPDTGEVLGYEEIAVGKIKIIEVMPKLSKGEVIEDFGVAAGSILRLPAAAKKP